MEAKKIIITGGATRIGAAIAKKLSGHNIEILIHYNKSKVKAEALKKNLQTSFDGNMIVSKGASQSFRIKKLQANSVVNSDEAIYLNLWQRQIETTGDDIISKSKNLFDGKVQIMATIDIYGNLISSKILISSGDKFIDEMALNILNESAPFAPFNQTMSSEYSILEIIRDWNFSSN